MSEAYDPDNLLDRNTAAGHDGGALRADAPARGGACWRGAWALDGGDVLSVGCGWNPGRHVFPAPAWRMTGVELEADEAGRAGGRRHPGRGLRGPRRRAAAWRPRPSTWCSTGWCCTTSPTRARWRRCSTEAARLLRPGGALVAVEPGALAPGGRGAGAGQPRWALGTAVHGTPDDIPLSPRRLVAEARARGPASPSCTRSPTPGGACRRRCSAALWPLDRALGVAAARGRAWATRCC